MFSQILEKAQTQKVREIRTIGEDLFSEERRTDRHGDANSGL